MSAQKPLTVTDDFDSSTITERFSHDPRCSERPLFETSYVCFVLSMERPTFVGHPFLLDPNHRKEPHNKIKIIALFKYRWVTNGTPRYLFQVNRIDFCLHGIRLILREPSIPDALSTSCSIPPTFVAFCLWSAQL